MTRILSRTGYVICVDNSGYPAALDLRKVYRTIADRRAAENGLIRVIDETGEDYLYPESMFAGVTLSPRARSTFASK